MVLTVPIEHYFLRLTLKNTIFNTDLLFILVPTNFGPPINSSAITHFRLSEYLTLLRGTHFDKHWSRGTV